MSTEVKAGYKLTEVGYIPNDWSISRLEQLVHSVEYGSSAKSSMTGKVPVLRMGNLQRGKIDWTDLVYTDDVKEIERYSLPTRSVLFNRTNTIDLVGKAAIYEGERPAIFAGYLIRIIEKKDLLDSKYLNYILNAEFSRKYSLKVLSVAVGQANINGQKLKTYPIPIPPDVSEQRAIATALSDMDALISGLDQLIAKKRDIKQATMQQLLTGQTRLPGFSGEWEVKRLGDVARLYQPVTISANQFSESGYPVYGANGVVGFYHNFNHEEWQVTITCRGSTCGTVNRTVDKSWITGNAMVVNCDHSNGLNKVFLYYLLLGQDLSACITGTGQPQIVRSPLASFEMSYPLDFEEQAAIAGVLSDIDAELTALEARRDKAKQLKQGMMQELLTGRIRLV